MIDCRKKPNHLSEIWYTSEVQFSSLTVYKCKKNGSTTTTRWTFNREIRTTSHNVKVLSNILLLCIYVQVRECTAVNRLSELWQQSK